MKNEKIISLIERKCVDELKAYFESASGQPPLDVHEEMVLLEHFSPDAVKSYINRFRFSEKAEVVFVTKSPRELCQIYINYYGLRDNTQKYIIDKDMVDVASDFMLMRRFWDDEYLIDNASTRILRPYILENALESDALVRKLFYHENKGLFASYVSRGRFISEDIKCEIVDARDDKAFQAIMYRFYNKFKRLARKSDNWQKLIKSKMVDYALSDELQLSVIRSFDRFMLEILLKTTPLCEEAQNLLFFYNTDVQWFKLHVSVMYGMAGYRFSEANEPKLFKVLAQKNLDDCLTSFRLRDDVSFINIASSEAVSKYIKDFWLTDDAQVALIKRGDNKLIKELISRYSPEHGMCWQAEVEMVRKCNDDVIKSYVSFHTMCREALDILKNKNRKKIIEYYYSLHIY